MQPNGDWIDLALEHEEVLHAGHSKKLSLGVAMKLPEGYEAHIIPRSSTFTRWGILLVNSMGLIDNSFCGPQDIWSFHAFAMVDITIPAGTRICQFRIGRGLVSGQRRDPVCLLRLRWRRRRRFRGWRR